MADLAVGISKAAVEALVSKVQFAIKEEADKWLTVQRDLVFITGEFEMMQSFLDTATEEHVKNKIVRTWVRQVRDLSYDVEDCIEFVLHIDTAKRSWWLRLLPSCSCGKTLVELPVDEAVAETTLLRARVVDVSQRNIRYNLIVDSASKPMATMDPVQKSALSSTSSWDILVNAVKKSGILDLAGLITREDTDLQVVTVCEKEGDNLVKVAIVRKMYSDARIHKEFQCRAWVKLVHPFNPHEVIRSMMTQFLTHSCPEQEQVIGGLDALERMQQASESALIKEFAQKVNTHRYLIVLEDLSTMVQWDAIRSYLPDRKKGSRIVVLTNHPVVASQCTGEPCRVSEIGQFSPSQSVHVYYKEDFQHLFMKTEPYSLFSYDLIGRDTEIDELLELTQKRQKSRLISVWGMPGVGKSALVKAIYCKLSTCDEFKRHVWVSVSHPFNPTDFCRSLLVNLQRSSSSLEGECAKAFRSEDPIEECRDQLRSDGVVCLFVIDGVHSNEDWDWIKSNLIQYGDSRSCIIIITSEETVAKHCAVSIDGVYSVKGLHANSANELFRKAIGANGRRYLRNFEMTQEAGLLMSKCGGLPKVIVTVATYLSTKARDVFLQELRRLNDNLMQELMSNPEFDSLRDIQAWMHSYLDACAQHQKKCMMYLSIFPQDTIIRRSRLIRRWIAEGYSKGTDSISIEKYADKIFDHAATLSIMQPVLEAGKVIGYQVNGFFTEYLMSRPAQERIFFPVEVSALEKQQHGRLTTEGIGQHLAIGSSWDTDPTVFESLDFSRLRSLTLFNRWFWSFFVSDRMKVLRMLDLENASIVTDYDFQEIGKPPSRLKSLSLRGQKNITRVPDLVGDLLQLQTLDIRDTKIATLPPFITKIRKLQYIRAGTTIAWTDDDIVSSSDDAEEGLTPSSSWSSTLACCLPNMSFFRRGARAPVGGFWSCSGGVLVPRGIHRLEALQTLSTVYVNTADGEAVLSEIVEYLPQLKKLKVSGIGGKHGLSSLYLLYKKTHLESLSLQFERSNHFHHSSCCVNIPKSLRSLKMMGHVEQLPPDIEEAVKIRKLTLEMTNALLKAELIRKLGGLPGLRTLRLHVNIDQQHGEIQFPSDLFSNLQVLEIAGNSKLHVWFEERAMEKLEQLKFQCLQGSEMQISGLEHPASLKQVWLLGCLDNELKEAVQQQLAKHPNKPDLKLKGRPAEDTDPDTSSSEA